MRRALLVAALLSSGWACTPTTGTSTPSPARTVASPPSAVTQLKCRLPVFTSGSFDPRAVTAPGAAGQGANVGFFQFPGGPAVMDSGDLIRFDPIRFRALTLVQPVLEAEGEGSVGSWDAVESRWVPVEAGVISPDGTTYAWTEKPSAEAPRSRIHVASVADGRDRIVLTSGSAGSSGVDFSAVRYDKDALLLTSLAKSEGGWYNTNQGLWRLDLTTGGVASVIPQADSWNVLSPHVAWSADVDPNGGPPVAAPSPDPGPMPNRLLRFDLTTGTVTIWITRPGKILMVLGVDLLDRPLLRVQSSTSTELAYSVAPDQMTTVYRSATPPIYGPGDDWNAAGLGYRPGEVMTDAHGIWLARGSGPDDQLFLFDPARGLQKLTRLGQSDSVHRWHPAGPCID